MDGRTIPLNKTLPRDLCPGGSRRTRPMTRTILSYPIHRLSRPPLHSSPFLIAIWIAVFLQPTVSRYRRLLAISPIKKPFSRVNYIPSIRIWIDLWKERRDLSVQVNRCISFASNEREKENRGSRRKIFLLKCGRVGSIGVITANSVRRPTMEEIYR